MSAFTGYGARAALTAQVDSVYPLITSVRLPSDSPSIAWSQAINSKVVPRLVISASRSATCVIQTSVSLTLDVCSSPRSVRGIVSRHGTSRFQMRIPAFSRTYKFDSETQHATMSGSRSNICWTAPCTSGLVPREETAARIFGFQSEINAAIAKGRWKDGTARTHNECNRNRRRFVCKDLPQIESQFSRKEGHCIRPSIYDRGIKSGSGFGVYLGFFHRIENQILHGPHRCLSAIRCADLSKDRFDMCLYRRLGNIEETRYMFV